MDQWFQRFQSRSRKLVSDLRAAYENLTVEQLSSTDTWEELISVDATAVRRVFDYMGRSCTKEMMDFILEKHSSRRLTSGFAWFKFITGTRGYGKSVSLNVAVGYLFVQSIEAAARLRTGPKQAEEQKAEQTLDVELGNRRFVYMAGHVFVANPARTLYKSLIHAYFGDDQGLAELESLKPDVESLSDFLQTREEDIYVVVDDANTMVIEDASEAEKKSQAWDALHACLSTNVEIILCGSISSKLREQLKKTPGTRYKLFSGRFSDPEVKAYWNRLPSTIIADIGSPEDILHATGWVPRLVDYYASDRPAYDMEVGHLAEKLEKEVAKLNPELLNAIAGIEVSPFTSALDSKCYYRGPDGKSACLAGCLHSRALAFLAKAVSGQDDKFAAERIQPYVRMIREVSNRSSIGWNAEAASILALRLLEVLLPGLSAPIKPEKVVLLEGKMSPSQLSSSGRKRAREGAVVPSAATLYIPLVFNHIGADVYYSSDTHLLVFHITVSARPEKTHPNTRKVAKELFKDDERKKAIVYVYPTDLSTIISDDGYDTIFCSFADLHPLLLDIDLRVLGLRPGKEACGSCRQPLQNGVECALCGTWLHEDCAGQEVSAKFICSDCKHAYGKKIIQSLLC